MLSTLPSILTSNALPAADGAAARVDREASSGFAALMQQQADLRSAMLRHIDLQALAPRHTVRPAAASPTTAAAPAQAAEAVPRPVRQEPPAPRPARTDSRAAPAQPASTAASASPDGANAAAQTTERTATAAPGKPSAHDPDDRAASRAAQKRLLARDQANAKAVPPAGSEGSPSGPGSSRATSGPDQPDGGPVSAQDATAAPGATPPALVPAWLQGQALVTGWRPTHDLPPATASVAAGPGAQPAGLRLAAHDTAGLAQPGLAADLLPDATDPLRDAGQARPLPGAAAGTAPVPGEPAAARRTGPQALPEAGPDTAAPALPAGLPTAALPTAHATVAARAGVQAGQAATTPGAARSPLQGGPAAEGPVDGSPDGATTDLPDASALIQGGTASGMPDPADPASLALAATATPAAAPLPAPAAGPEQAFDQRPAQVSAGASAQGSAQGSAPAPVQMPTTEPAARPASVRAVTPPTQHALEPARPAAGLPAVPGEGVPGSAIVGETRTDLPTGAGLPATDRGPRPDAAGDAGPTASRDRAGDEALHSAETLDPAAQAAAAAASATPGAPVAPALAAAAQTTSLRLGPQAEATPASRQPASGDNAPSRASRLPPAIDRTPPPNADAPTGRSQGPFGLRPIAETAQRSADTDSPRNPDDRAPMPGPALASAGPALAVATSHLATQAESRAAAAASTLDSVRALDPAAPSMATPVLASGSAPAAAAPLGTTLTANAAPVAEARIPVPLDSPAFAPALGAQISLFARDGVQTARLQLNPAEMGPITVQIALDGSAARVDFQADLAGTREVIESSLPALAGALQEAGMTLAGGGVSQQPSSHQPPPQADASGTQRRAAERQSGTADMPMTAPLPARTRGLVDLVA